MLWCKLLLRKPVSQTLYLMVCASLSWKLLGTSGPALHVRVSRSRNSVVAEETRSQPPMMRTRFEPTLAQVWWYLESEIR